MNLLVRVRLLFRRGLEWVDSFALPPDPSWGIAARIWTDPRWSCLCLIALVAVVLHPPDGMTYRLCLFHLMYGVDCPGCGMTRALSYLVRGHAVTALQLHPFSPLVLIYLILQAVSPFLPARIKVQVAEKLTRHRAQLGVLFWTMLGLFFLYGMGRAMVQFVVQGASQAHPGSPSFRMGW